MFIEGKIVILLDDIKIELGMLYPIAIDGKESTLWEVMKLLKEKQNEKINTHPICLGMLSDIQGYLRSANMLFNNIMEECECSLWFDNEYHVEFMTLWKKSSAYVIFRKGHEIPVRVAKNALDGFIKQISEFVDADEIKEESWRRFKTGTALYKR